MVSRLSMSPVFANRLSTLARAGVLAALAFTVLQVHADGLSLQDALQQSLQRSALTRAADAAVHASRELAAKADQLPDPMLKVGIENVPVDGADRFSTSRDFMTMRRIGIEQQWVSADKRAARSQRAQRAVEMEEGAYLESVARVREETARTWLSALYAQRALAVVQAVENEAAQDLATLRAAHRGASAGSSAAEVLQAQVVLSQAQDVTRRAEQELRNTRLTLQRWTGGAPGPVADDTPALISHVSTLSVEDLEKYHPGLLAARRAIGLAEAETLVATRERRPDWTVEAGFSQRGSQYSNMLSIGLSIPLSLNRGQKQDRDIAEKSALGTKALLQYEETLRAMQNEIATLSGDLANLKERAASLNAEILPAASQQVALATAAYRGGSGSLSAVFGARRMLLERQLQILEIEKEAALTWARLEYHVVPHELAVARSAK